MYCDVAMPLMKTDREHVDTFRHWKGPLQAPLKGSLTLFEHLFLFLQDQCELKRQSYMHWPHSAIHLIGGREVGSASEEEVACVQMVCYHCLPYLGDLSCCWNQFLALASKGFVGRCYNRALAAASPMGMPSASQELSQGISTMVSQPHTSTSAAAASTQQCLIKGHCGTSNNFLTMQGKGIIIWKGAREAAVSQPGMVLG